MTRRVNVEVALALDLLGSAYRGDWSDFDGRSLRAQLDDLSAVLRNDKAKVRGQLFDAKEWAKSEGICPKHGCWDYHCQTRHEEES